MTRHNFSEAFCRSIGTNPPQGRPSAVAMLCQKLWHPMKLYARERKSQVEMQILLEAQVTEILHDAAQSPVG